MFQLTVGENDVSHGKETIAEANFSGGMVDDGTLALDSSSDHSHHDGNEHTQERLKEVS